MNNEMFSLITAIWSLVLSLIVYIQTRKFNELSMKPLCFVELSVIDKILSISILNKWRWPMIVRSIKKYDWSDFIPSKFINENWIKNLMSEDIINWERVVAPEINDKFTLIETEENKKIIDLLTKEIKSLNIEYYDIFWKPQETFISNLIWFSEKV